MMGTITFPLSFWEKVSRSNPTFHQAIRKTPCQKNRGPENVNRGKTWGKLGKLSPIFLTTDQQET